MKAVKISTVRKNEPLLVVAEGPEGKLQVVDGDPEMFERLGLAKYKDLNGVLRGVHRSSELRAEELEINDKNEAEPVPQAPPPGPEVVAVKIQEFEEKLKSPLDAMKAIWDKFRDHVKLRAREAQTEEDLKGAQEVHKKTLVFEGVYYVSYDGDNIGKKAEFVEQKDDPAALQKLSDQIQRGNQATRDWAQQYGGEVIEQGGDEGMLKVPSEAMKHIDALRVAYKQVAKATITVGTGKSLSDAMKARELGKLRGKNCVVHHDENTDQELQLRLDQGGGEAPKEEDKEEKEWSMRHYNEEASPTAVEQMIKELIEEGISNRDQIMAVLADHGLESFPGIEQMVDAMVGSGEESPASEPT